MSRIYAISWIGKGLMECVVQKEYMPMLVSVLCQLIIGAEIVTKFNKLVKDIFRRLSVMKAQVHIIAVEKYVNRALVTTMRTESMIVDEKYMSRKLAEFRLILRKRVVKPYGKK